MTVGVGAAALAAAGIAYATGFVGSPTITTLATGSLPDATQLNASRIKFETKDPTTVVQQSITWHAGDSSGWHSHPGFVLVVVKSGPLYYETADCVTHTYASGQMFIESGSDPARVVQPAGASDATIYETYVIPADRPARVDAQAPSCGTPQNKLRPGAQVDA